MKPSIHALRALAAWMAMGTLASIWPVLAPLWWGVSAVLALIAAGDAFAGFRLARPSVRRATPARFAAGVPGLVRLELENPSRWPGRFELFDGIPPESECDAMPWRGTVPARGLARIEYPLTLLRRGRLPFARTHVQRLTPFVLWHRRYLLGTAETVKVYPNYEPVVRFSLLAMEHREDQMGIVHKNRRGLSREFHQLREYQEGDGLAQVDWKASARRMALISREYREQKNQTVVFLVDCGRRLRAIDGELPQFDHCLNALLLMSYVALRQGDHVGVLSFGGRDRWLPPVKGTNAMPTLLNHVYDYDTTLAPSDFGEGVNRLMQRQRRRSLVILLTNLRSEDVNDILPALQSLRRRHLVVLASLREQELDQIRSRSVTGFEEALRTCATECYLEERALVLRKLQAVKILTVDATARTLPVELTNRYLEIKQAGLL